MWRSGTPSRPPAARGRPRKLANFSATSRNTAGGRTTERLALTSPPSYLFVWGFWKVDAKCAMSPQDIMYPCDAQTPRIREAVEGGGDPENHAGSAGTVLVGDLGQTESRDCHEPRLILISGSRT